MLILRPILLCLMLRPILVRLMVPLIPSPRICTVAGKAVAVRAIRAWVMVPARSALGAFMVVTHTAVMARRGGGAINPLVLLRAPETSGNCFPLVMALAAPTPPTRARASPVAERRHRRNNRAVALIDCLWDEEGCHRASFIRKDLFVIWSHSLVRSGKKKRRSADPSTRKNREERPGNHYSLWPSRSRLAVTIQHNHRWIQMNTDKNCSEPHTFMAKIRSPDSNPKQREARPAFGPKNLCSSVFICGFLLHGYGLEPI